MTSKSALPDDRRRRIAAVDAARGVAIAAMIVYHLSWDLSYFGFFSVNVVADPGWKAFARTIAGTFIMLVGISLVLASRQGLQLKPYLWRLAMVVGAALLITVGTWFAFPEAYVFFGILHVIAFASVVALPFLWLPTSVTLIVGVGVFTLPFFYSSRFFDAPLLMWLGLSQRLPNSVDYVPVFPWFAMALFGIVAGRLLVRYGSDSGLALWTPSHLPGRAAVFAGRWSLLIYLVHQPVLFGLVWTAAHLALPNPNYSVEALMRVCVPECRATGHAPPVCETFCFCMLNGMDEAGFLQEAASDRLSAEQNDMRLALVDQCSPSDADLSAAEDGPPPE